jgi:hypothetical protein
VGSRRKARKKVSFLTGSKLLMVVDAYSVNSV